MILEEIDARKATLWFNLCIGFYNLMIYVRHDSLFNLVIGALNIGVWVFFRNYFDEV